MNYLTSLDSREEGLTLIRHGAMLDPENRLGLLDALRSAVSQVQGNVTEEMDSFQQRREEILSEIQQAFLLVEGVSIDDPSQITPQLEIASLGSSPDIRTDRLEEAARPRFVDTVGGRIGQVSCTTAIHPGTHASLPNPYVRGRPGLNPLRVDDTIQIKKRIL